MVAVDLLGAFFVSLFVLCDLVVFYYFGVGCAYGFVAVAVSSGLLWASYVLVCLSAFIVLVGGDLLIVLCIMIIVFVYMVVLCLFVDGMLWFGVGECVLVMGLMIGSLIMFDCCLAF